MARQKKKKIKVVFLNINVRCDEHIHKDWIVPGTFDRGCIVKYHVRDCDD